MVALRNPMATAVNAMIANRLGVGLWLAMSKPMATAAAIQSNPASIKAAVISQRLKERPT
jgi:hypothetical protein